MPATPRLRMFAGPNGSGKSTIVAADFIRQNLTYLYYIATDDPSINCSRVAHRVKMGGHPVPEDKIISRYYRSLKLLRAAIRQTHRAYIFDNSQENMLWIAEITNGHELQYHQPQIPFWFHEALSQNNEQEHTEP